VLPFPMLRWAKLFRHRILLDYLRWEKKSKINFNHKSVILRYEADITSCVIWRSVNEDYGTFGTRFLCCWCELSIEVGEHMCLECVGTKWVWQNSPSVQDHKIKFSWSLWTIKQRNLARSSNKELKKIIRSHSNFYSKRFS
jgi:hypothetical protein